MKMNLLKHMKTNLKTGMFRWKTVDALSWVLALITCFSQRSRGYDASDQMRRFLYFTDNNARSGGGEDKSDDLIHPLIPHLLSKWNAVPMSEKVNADEEE